MTSIGWICLLLCVVAGCSQKTAEPVGPKAAFEQLVTEFKKLAATKASEQLSIAVTDELSAGKNASDAATGIVHVRKQTPNGVPGNAKKTAEVIEAHFKFEGGRWRCAKATSKEMEGEKVAGRNSIEGPDIELANLIRWMGL